MNASTRGASDVAGPFAPVVLTINRIRMNTVDAGTGEEMSRFVGIETFVRRESIDRLNRHPLPDGKTGTGPFAVVCEALQQKKMEANDRVVSTRELVCAPEIEFKDPYEDALRALIQQNAKGCPVRPSLEAERSEKVVDLREALRESLDETGQKPRAPGPREAGAGRKRAA